MKPVCKTSFPYWTRVAASSICRLRSPVCILLLPATIPSDRLKRILRLWLGSVQVCIPIHSEPGAINLPYAEPPRPSFPLDGQWKGNDEIMTTCACFPRLISPVPLSQQKWHRPCQKNDLGIRLSNMVVYWDSDSGLRCNVTSCITCLSDLPVTLHSTISITFPCAAYATPAFQLACMKQYCGTLASCQKHLYAFAIRAGASFFFQL